MGNAISDSKNPRPNAKNTYAGDITPLDAWEMLKSDKGSILVDVRTAEEWAFVGQTDLSSLGKSSVFISWRLYPKMAVNDHFVNQLLSQKDVSKDCNIVFLCKIGMRSLDAAIEMAKHGFTNCYNIEGGFEGELDENGHRGVKNGWKSYNLPWEQK